MSDIGGSQVPCAADGGTGLPLPTSSIAARSTDNTIRILLATDNHIGYAEKDPIRGADSINTFREILQLSIEHDVDMLLLAGDLFHENRPSRDSLYLTIAALREYCLNRRPISLEIVSDEGIGLNRDFEFNNINYYDENLNVGLPVFSIHGNHDDPQGVGPHGALCALDILAASGLINYFGRQDLPGSAQTDGEALDRGIQIKPVLIQKGRTKLGLYGIGNIRDERFHYELRSGRVSMYRPADDPEEWFNILLVHQNRVAHGPKNSVPDDAFGDEVDLVVWGHEHDCRIEPEQVSGKDYYITQPGSSIATSLAKGESLKKHVALLEIQDRDFMMTPIPLKTVRPFIFHEIVLADDEEQHGLDLDNKVKVTKYLKKVVNGLIKQAEEQWKEDHADEENSPKPALPLIRLRVEYTKEEGGAYEVGNPQRFGAEFVGKVANTKDVVQFYRRKRAAIRKAKNDIDLPEDDECAELSEKVEKVQVSTLVHQYLEAQNLGVLAENGMQRAVAVFVEKDDKDAIKDFYQEALRATWNTINSETKIDEDDFERHMTRAKEKYAEEWEKEAGGGGSDRPTKSSRAKGRRRGAAASDSEGSEDSFGRMSVASSVAGTSNAKGKSATGRRAKPKDKVLFIEESDDSEGSVEPVKKQAATKKAPAAKKAAPKKPAASRKGQTQLNFSPVPARGASSRAAASRARSKVANDDSEEGEDSVFEVEDNSEDARPKKKTTRSRR